MGTKVSVDGGEILKKFLKNIQEQTENASLVAGFTDSKYATEAFQNEYGGWYPTSEEWQEKAKRKGIKNPPKQAHIIPRPFMLDTMQEKKKEWHLLLLKSLAATKFNVKLSLEFLGQRMKKDIQDKIRNNNYPRTGYPYSEVKGHENPLVDTGGMLQNVTYKVGTK